jgi:hypothetical protein
VITEGAQLSMDFADAPAARDLRGKIGLRHPAHAHARSVVEGDLHLLRVVDGFSGHLCVHSARIVGEHTPEATMAMRRRLRAIRQIERLRRVHDVVADHPRQDARDAPVMID